MMLIFITVITCGLVDFTRIRALIFAVLGFCLMSVLVGAHFLSFSPSAGRMLKWIFAQITTVHMHIHYALHTVSATGMAEHHD
jgi:hypothetical protein